MRNPVEARAIGSQGLDEEGEEFWSEYSVFEPFEDNAAGEYQLPPACPTAQSRNLVPISLKNPVLWSFEQDGQKKTRSVAPTINLWICK